MKPAVRALAANPFGRWARVWAIAKPYGGPETKIRRGSLAGIQQGGANYATSRSWPTALNHIANWFQLSLFWSTIFKRAALLQEYSATRAMYDRWQRDLHAS